MKRILPAVCFACAAAVAVSAQSTSPATQPPTDKPQDQARTSSADKGKSVTLTGCVRQGDEANQFVLANVDANELKRATGQMGTQTGTSAGSTTGTAAGSTPGSPTGTATGTTGAGSADRMGAKDDANTVQLVDSGNVNLRQHVGHQVRVTGTMAKPGMDSDRPRSETGTAGTGASSTPSTSDTTARAGEYGKADKDKDKKKHKVSVQSVQMISESCQ